VKELVYGLGGLTGGLQKEGGGLVVNEIIQLVEANYERIEASESLGQQFFGLWEVLREHEGVKKGDVGTAPSFTNKLGSNRLNFPPHFSGRDDVDH